MNQNKPPPYDGQSSSKRYCHYCEEETTQITLPSNVEPFCSVCGYYESTNKKLDSRVPLK